MLKLLIVDDNKQVRNFIKMVLRQSTEAVQYIECNNGEDAVIMYEQEHPDLVLMDIMMDKLDGLSALKRIHQLDSNSKVIIVSQLPDAEYEDEAIGMGAIGYLNKEHLYRLPKIINSYTSI